MAGNDVNTLLLLHGEDLTDASQYARVLTNSGVTVSDAQSKFGGKSLYFTGGAHLKFHSIDFGSADFTVDWWELATASDAGTRFTNMSADSIETSKGLLIGAYETKANIYMASNGASSWDLLSQTTCFYNNYPQAWTHRAVVRNGSKVVCYANGKQEYSYDIGAAKVGYSPNYPAAIGAWTTSYMQAGYYFTGYIDEFRISDVARWTADFVPPSKPYESPAASPSAPSSLAYTQVNDVVSLTWSASSNAEKYRVYLDYGLIAETTSTEYTDTIVNSPAAHVYAITAVNEFGESDFSEFVRVELWGDTAPDLIYDRTPSDIEKAVVLINKRLSGEKLTEDDRELWDKGLRGCYNTSDVNRVEYHTRELQSILNSNGYNIHIDTRLWAKPDIMRYSDIIRYLGNIKTILDAFGRSANAPELPSIDRWIDYIAANDIEKILYVTRELIYGALAMFRRAGTFRAGGDYLAQVIRRA